MPVLRSQLEDECRRLHDRIQSLPGVNDAGWLFRSIHLLLPHNENLSALKEVLYCQESDVQGYRQATKDFIGENLDRSLFYLKPPVGFLFDSLDRGTEPIVIQVSNGKQFDLLPDLQPFEVGNIPDRFKDPDNLMEYWNAWIRCLSDQRCGSWTLWTAFELRNEDDTFPFTAAAFMLFDGDLGEKGGVRAWEKILQISRQVEESLFHLTLDMMNSGIKNRATRAAISQVMARNMSHNINSHVSYKATNPNVKKRILELYGHEVK